MKKSSNIIVIGAGVLLMIVAFLGVVLYNRLMNPEPNYVLAAAVNIEANTDLVSLGRDSFIMIDVPNKATASTFVTENDFLKMQAKGGQFVRSVRQNEPIKYTDISSEANPVAANAITLGINDPNKVVMTIDVEGIAPNGIQQGDYIDIVAVTTIEGEDVYENELANLLAEARKAALAQIESAENINTAIDFKDLDTNTAYSDSYSFENVMDTFGSFSFGGDSSQTAESDQNMFTVSAPSMTEELEKAANELSD
ncbi:MAG: hypothetical protein IJI14_17480, partial [Anaerolineaceae bacterium]|nr:hypothetical protein [Anaerolineaceae bacterium]